MQVVEGDLIELALSGEFDVIIHGCNCFCKMGAGIAKTIKLKFPEAFEADCASVKGSREKLGDFTIAMIHSEGGHEFAVVNAYTQYHWKGKGVKVDYDAIGQVMRKVKEHFSGKRIGYPLIGAGLAGGDWGIISPIIDHELKGEKHTLVRYRATATQSVSFERSQPHDTKGLEGNLAQDDLT